LRLLLRQIQSSLTVDKGVKKEPAFEFNTSRNPERKNFKAVIRQLTNADYKALGRGPLSFFASSTRHLFGVGRLG
jgi:hypothetical protein